MWLVLWGYTDGVMVGVGDGVGDVVVWVSVL